MIKIKKAGINNQMIFVFPFGIYESSNSGKNLPLE